MLLYICTNTSKCSRLPCTFPGNLSFGSCFSWLPWLFPFLSMFSPVIQHRSCVVQDIARIGYSQCAGQCFRQPLTTTGTTCPGCWITAIRHDTKPQPGVCIDLTSAALIDLDRLDKGLVQIDTHLIASEDLFHQGLPASGKTADGFPDFGFPASVVTGHGRSLHNV